MSDSTYLKAVQLLITSSGGSLYATAVKEGHQGANSISLADCGTWPLAGGGEIPVDSSTDHGYGVASLGYVITASPATVHRLSSFVSIDQLSPTYLGAGSDASLLTAISATLGGQAIAGAGAAPVTAEVKRQIGALDLASSALVGSLPTQLAALTALTKM